jgi:hypothetical protein
MRNALSKTSLPGPPSSTSATMTAVTKLEW